MFNNQEFGPGWTIFKVNLKKMNLLLKVIFCGPQAYKDEDYPNMVL